MKIEQQIGKLGTIDKWVVQSKGVQGRETLWFVEKRALLAIPSHICVVFPIRCGNIFAHAHLPQQLPNASAL